MKRTCIPAAALLLSGPCTAIAVELEPIVVTATRTAQTVDDTLASVSVIERDDIERLQAQSVQDVLRGLPGVDVANSGGLGKQTSVFLRGTESDHVLVLIDGVKVGSATLGTTGFENIPVGQIERIEIVRGPRSSLYGSEAIGGVIQIFTRKGARRFTPSFSIGGGSFETGNGSVGIAGGGNQGWYNLSGTGLGTAGFNACNGRPFPNGAGCFTIEPDKDGYRNLSGSLGAGYRFDFGLEADLHALVSSGDSKFDGTFQNETEMLQSVFGGSFRYSPWEFWDISLKAGRSLDNSDNFLNGTFQSRFDTTRDSIFFQNDLSLFEDHLATLGLDFQADRVNSNTPFTVTSRDNLGAFALYQGSYASHHLELSIRRDDNQQFGIHTTGGAAWGYEVIEGIRFSVSYGTAFKAPTFNELYFPDFGNPNLTPETSRSLEFGLRGRHSAASWSLNVYETRVNDQIAFDADTFSPANIDQARIRGLEAILKLNIFEWDLTTNFTLLDPQNLSNGPDHGNVLPRRAEQSFRIDADRRIGDFQVGATIQGQGRRFDDLANTRRLGGYNVIDLRAEYEFFKNWRMQARLVNLLDKDYETAAFFNQQRRSWFLTLRYQS
ncbi:MAG: TonB-dependent vitamin B12 receptor [Gammaproteobacteria bacterium]